MAKSAAMTARTVRYVRADVRTDHLPRHGRPAGFTVAHVQWLPGEQWWCQACERRGCAHVNQVKGVLRDE